MYQQLFGFVHTNIIQIVDKFLSGLLFEKLAEIASVQVKEGSDEFLSDIFLIVSLDIKLNLINQFAGIVDTLFLQQGCISGKTAYNTLLLHQKKIRCLRLPAYWEKLSRNRQFFSDSNLKPYDNDTSAVRNGISHPRVYRE